MMKFYRILILAIGVLCMLFITVAAEVPQMINYQGRLTDSGGEPVSDGFYEVRFEIWDTPEPSDMDIMLWTSGTVTVSVSNGLFTHILGSANPLPPSVFIYDGPLGRYIATEVIGQGVTPPRLPLLATPYAYQAINADTADYALSGPGGSGEGVWTLNGSDIYYNDGNVGIGTMTPNHKLDVNGSINTDSVYLAAGDTVLHALGNRNISVGKGSGVNSSGSYNTFVGADAAPNNQGAYNVMVGQAAGHWHIAGDFNTFVGAAAGNGNVDGARNTFIGKGAGQNATGSDNVFLGRGAGYSNTDSHTLIINNTTAGTPLIYGDFLTERVGMGTVEPLASLDVRAAGHDAIRGSTSDDEGSSGVLGIGTGPQNYGVQGTVDGTLAIGVRGYASGINGIGVSGTADDENGFGVLGASSNVDGGTGVYGLAMGTNGYGVHGQAVADNGTGVYGQADGHGGRGVHGYALSDYGWSIYGHALGEYGIGVYGRAPGTWGCGVYGLAEGASGIGVHAESSHAGATALVVDGNSEAQWAAEIKGNVRIKNHSYETIVELGEGLDYAEGFNTASSTQVAPGTVMIIDPLNPGNLAVSDRAYDSRVAGIVAGANGLGSGVRLGTDKFDVDVALAGRVYCNVDASEAGIEPGDLLTTSALPGYAMKATDHLRTHGAILGKAMERLERGEQGQILVLVTLH